MSSSFTILAIIFLLIFLAMTGGTGYLIYYVIKKSTEKKSDEFVHKEQTMMKKWVAEKKKDLVSWEGHDFTDIGSRMKYTTSKTTLRKVFGTLHDKKNKPIIAFHRLERGFKENGYMFASSTQFDLSYLLMDGTYKISFNDTLLGTITKAGQIIDAQGKTIGFAKHPQKADLNLPFYRHRFGDSSFDFKMNNRLLAKITVAPNMNGLTSPNRTNIEFSNENLGNQLVRLEDRNYTQEEEKWLIAVAVLEAAVHGFWFV